MGFPPGEAREESANASAHCDFFGAGRLRPADVKRLVESEAVSTSDMFVLVSDVWLDKPTTLSRLKMIFEGFDGSDAIPTMFVLMGDFCSTPLNTGNTQQGANFETYKQGFDRLADLLEHFPRLRCGTFPSTTLRVPDTCTVQSTGPTLPNPGYTRGLTRLTLSALIVPGKNRAGCSSPGRAIRASRRRYLGQGCGKAWWGGYRRCYPG